MAKIINMANLKINDLRLENYHQILPVRLGPRFSVGSGPWIPSVTGASGL